jgi:hypothetical protein
LPISARTPGTTDARTSFFGDVRRSPGPAWPPDDSDLVAFIEDVPFPAGGHLATARQSDHPLDVFFIRNDGAFVFAVGDRWRTA